MKAGPADKPVPTPVFLLFLLAAMAVFYTADRTLATAERSETRNDANRHALAGRQLLAYGRAQQAIEEFSRARALERDDRGFQLDLASAQLAGNRLPEAAGTLDDLLEQDSNDGRANLLMARTAAAQGRVLEADRFYHRAIYGAWQRDAGRSRTAARFELARFLADRRRTDELQGELLQLAAQAKESPEIEHQLAALFLQAGMADRAVQLYRTLVGRERDDADAYEGLGQAELIRGNFGAERNAFASAAMKRPEDAKLREDLALATQAAELDPVARHLGPAERLRRSTEILRLAANNLRSCAETAGREQASLAEADRVLSQRAAGALGGEETEERLALAERLWKAMPVLCRPPRSPLLALMRKLQG